MQEVTKELQPKWNAVIVDVFAAFIRICEQYGLRYFCAGGTAIGAVRHQGMIPWDDDIDVSCRVPTTTASLLWQPIRCPRATR